MIRLNLNRLSVFELFYSYELYKFIHNSKENEEFKHGLVMSGDGSSLSNLQKTKFQEDEGYSDDSKIYKFHHNSSLQKVE